MTIELKIPDVGESIQEVLIGRWLKQEGDRVEMDEDVVELDTDKASMELPAPAAGVIKEILKSEGEAVSIGDTIAVLDESDAAVADEDAKASHTEDGPAKSDKKSKQKDNKKGKRKKEQQSEHDEVADADTADETDEVEKDREDKGESVHVTPSARRALREHGLSPDDIRPAGDRIRRSDIQRFVEQQKQKGSDGKTKERRDSENTESAKEKTAAAERPAEDEQLEETVPMSLVRRRIAERLVEAQQKAALLTTFNEIDMSAVIELRKEFGERFHERYGIKLGFMSFFVKAAVDALKEYPEVNSEVRGTDVVYRNYFHIGIAIGNDRGLVVPVLRHAERMSFAGIEQAIDDFATRAQHNKIKPDELAGGTFTISNGGIYGSLLSTPIVNPPQSGVLGMHSIQQRPVALDGEVVIRPMMYVALTYDHRIVDGREAVSFVRRVKETIEEPSRMLIEV